MDLVSGPGVARGSPTGSRTGGTGEDSATGGKVTGAAVTAEGATIARCGTTVFVMNGDLLGNKTTPGAFPPEPEPGPGPPGPAASAPP
jgi:hypothetical protein